MDRKIQSSKKLSKVILFTFLFFVFSFSLALGAGDIYLDNGNSYTQNVGTIPFSDTHDEGYVVAKHHSLFNVDTNEFLCNADGASGDLVGDCGSWTASTTGAYSFVLSYDGDTLQCRNGTGGYTGCVVATFVDEYLFDIVGESSSTPSSTATSSLTVATTTLVNYLIILIEMAVFIFSALLVVWFLRRK